MKLTKIVHKIKERFVWEKIYPSNEPIFLCKKDNRSIFEIWKDSSRFWCMFHDIDNALYPCLNREDIIYCLERAILDKNWENIKKIDKSGIMSPSDCLIDLNKITGKEISCIRSSAEFRCKEMNDQRKNLC